MFPSFHVVLDFPLKCTWYSVCCLTFALRILIPNQWRKIAARLLCVCVCVRCLCVCIYCKYMYIGRTYFTFYAYLWYLILLHTFANIFTLLICLRPIEIMMPFIRRSCLHTIPSIFGLMKWMSSVDVNIIVKLSFEFG